MIMFALTAPLMKTTYPYQVAALALFQKLIQTKSIGLPYLFCVHKVAKEATLYLWCLNCLLGDLSSQADRSRYAYPNMLCIPIHQPRI